MSLIQGARVFRVSISRFIIHLCIYVCALDWNQCPLKNKKKKN